MVLRTGLVCSRRQVRTRTIVVCMERVGLSLYADDAGLVKETTGMFGAGCSLWRDLADRCSAGG
jgi:hypothetical protein